jgi:hypothetical protein
MTSRPNSVGARTDIVASLNRAEEQRAEWARRNRKRVEVSGARVVGSALADAEDRRMEKRRAYQRKAWAGSMKKRLPDPGECGLCKKFLRWRVAGLKTRRAELEAMGLTLRCARLREEPREIAPPSDPTDARPGSEEKIAVMEARYARGEGIFHRQDRSNRGGRPR